MNCERTKANTVVMTGVMVVVYCCGMLHLLQHFVTHRIMVSTDE